MKQGKKKVNHPELVVTEVKTSPAYSKDSPSLRGIATVILSDQIKLTDLMICEEKAWFVAYPRSIINDDEWASVYYPLRSKLCNRIQKAVLKDFHSKYLKEQKYKMLPKVARRMKHGSAEAKV